MTGVAEVVERLKRSTVWITSGRGGGSGVVWDRNGAIITNAHVAPAAELKLIDHSGRAHRGRVMKRDAQADLALIETGARGLEPVVIGDSNRLRPGEIAIAVGNPLGVNGAASWGIIHSVGPLDFGARRTWIQADVRLAPGNSGGALATASGEVIGINTMIFGGLGLAAPANEVRSFVEGASDRARLGVEMVHTPEGLLVVAVEPDSPAAHAGVLMGDILRCAPDELKRLLGGVMQFGSAEIDVSRGGSTRTLRVFKAAAGGARAA